MPKPPRRTLGPYPVPQETMDLLAALQKAVRDLNQIPPSKGLVIAALIYAAPKEGKQFTAKVLAPYLRDHPAEEKPR